MTETELVILVAQKQILINQMDLSRQCLHSNPRPILDKEKTEKTIEQIDNIIKETVKEIRK